MTKVITTEPAIVVDRSHSPASNNPSPIISELLAEPGGNSFSPNVRLYLPIKLE